MAAAFAALVSLENNLNLIQNHPTHSFCFEHTQIRALEESVRFLINFMKSYDYSIKEAAEALETRIARAAEAAEDVIESHAVEQILSEKTRGSKAPSSRYLLDLQKVIEDMDYMRRKASNVEARSRVEAEQPPASKPQTRLSSNKNFTVGFDDILLQILDQLTGVPSSRRFIPIVGMGGIGKTTLATNAFLHPSIVQHYDVRLWATISQKYNVRKILKQLLSVDESTSETVAELGLRLHKNLYRRRYLIVLDDMWSVEAWDEIKFFFPDNDNGSRITVTTRHSDVANHLGFSSLDIKFLDEENSWNLFCQKAFAAEQGCPRELTEVGKKIVEKCNGLPLPIVVVAAHLRTSSMTLEYWENAANHMNSILNYEEQCLNVLSLSYSHLPPHLKPCFLLLGAFPEDEEIYGGYIRKLWIAEGLIEPVESSSLEEVAEDYLWDLYERNLILVDAFDFNGKIVHFKLHDLLREMCIKIGEKEEFLLALDSPRAINTERRVVISGEEVTEANHLTKTLDVPTRCLIYEGDWLPYNLKLLRTLNTVVPASTSVSMFEQVNLRFLEVDLENTHLPTLYLPSSISLLWNLQMLSIDVPDQSRVIAPYEIWEMLQLRHLEINLICLVDPLPVERLEERSDLVMKNLHTLWKVEIAMLCNSYVLNNVFKNVLEARTNKRVKIKNTTFDNPVR